MPYVFPVLLLGIIILYYFANPLTEKFPFQCPWRVLTGTQCPACGFQRAMHALLHGEFCKALGYNYFFVFSVPYAFAAVVVTCYNRHHVFDRLKAFVCHPIVLRLYVLLFLAWWVIRNVYDI